MPPRSTGGRRPCRGSPKRRRYRRCRQLFAPPSPPCCSARTRSALGHRMRAGRSPDRCRLRREGAASLQMSCVPHRRNPRTRRSRREAHLRTTRRKAGGCLASQLTPPSIAQFAVCDQRRALRLAHCYFLYGHAGTCRLGRTAPTRAAAGFRRNRWQVPRRPRTSDRGPARQTSNTFILSCCGIGRLALRTPRAASRRTASSFQGSSTRRRRWRASGWTSTFRARSMRPRLLPCKRPRDSALIPLAANGVSSSASMSALTGTTARQWGPVPRPPWTATSAQVSASVEGIASCAPVTFTWRPSRPPGVRCAIAPITACPGP